MRKLSWPGALSLGVLVFSMAAVSAAPKPPVAKIEPKIDTLFGHVMVDNYAWFRNRENPDVLEYIKAENAYADSVTASTKDLRDTLYKEMVARIKETDLSVPVRDSGYFYYSRDEAGKQYKVYCRKKGTLDAPEEVLLDVNKLAEGKDFMSIGTNEVSPDQQVLAYATDDQGNERYSLHFKNLATGELYPEVVDSIAGPLVFANDNKTVFYVIADQTWRPYKVIRHELGTDPKTDVEVFHEPDSTFWLDLGKTLSNAYLVITLATSTTSEVHVLDANAPMGKFTVIEPRRKDVEYYVNHRGDKFYIRTNDSARNFRLMEAPVAGPGRANWKEIVPHRKDVMLEGVDLYRDYMVLWERTRGNQTARVYDFAAKKYEPITFREQVYSVDGGDNREFNSPVLRFNYTSFVTPASVYDYNMKTKQRELKKQREVVGGYNPNDYQSKRLFATASDGAKVPISLVYKKGVRLDGSAPLLLDGYGAYGYSLDPYFSSNRLSLLNRGVIFAVAHIRGGGEMGRIWYDDGKLFKKKNTFTDFIATAEYLIKQKYTSKEHLVVIGGSAGGLLIGTVVNMRPDLFKAAVAQVPFVDLINTMLDASIPLTTNEYEEWGDPNQKDFFEYMLSYSPYDNVAAKTYPALLVEPSLNDTRVGYYEGTKWTAKLRAMKTDSNVLILRTNMGAGHGGASGRYSALEEIAFEYAFILEQVGKVRRVH